METTTTNPPTEFQIRLLPIPITHQPLQVETILLVPPHHKKEESFPIQLHPRTPPRLTIPIPFVL